MKILSDYKFSVQSIIQIISQNITKNFIISNFSISCSFFYQSWTDIDIGHSILKSNNKTIVFKMSTLYFYKSVRNPQNRLLTPQ